MLLASGRLARREGEGRRRRIVALRRALLGIAAQRFAENALGLLGRYRLLTARRPAAVILPFLHPVPHVEAGGEGANVELGIGGHQCCDHRLRPRPVGAGEEGGILRRLAYQRIMAVGQPRQQVIGNQLQCHEIIVIGFQRQRPGKPCRCRRRKARRAHEGEKLGHIEVALLARRANVAAIGGNHLPQPFAQ